MSLPICGDCARTGLLCPECERKFREREITEIDVELSRILHKLTSGDVGFKQAVDTRDGVIVLAEKKDVGKLIGVDGSTIKTLLEELGKDIKVIGLDDRDEMIRHLVAPAVVKSINEVYKPDGLVTYKVRINRMDENKLRMSLCDVTRIASSAADTEVDFELD